VATERKQVLLRLDPAVHDALARWAGDELRSTNAQIEFLLRRALAEAGRLPAGIGRMRPRGRIRPMPHPPGRARRSAAPVQTEGERTSWSCPSPCRHGSTCSPTTGAGNG
jgi:hypothetical protein